MHQVKNPVLTWVQLFCLQVKKSVTDFAKSLEKPSSEKVNADEGVYYLVSPDGSFVQAFGHDEDASAIAHAVSLLAIFDALCSTVLSFYSSCACSQDKCLYIRLSSFFSLEHDLQKKAVIGSESPLSLH